MGMHCVLAYIEIEVSKSLINLHIIHFPGSSCAYSYSVGLRWALRIEMQSYIKIDDYVTQSCSQTLFLGFIGNPDRISKHTST